MAKIGSTEGSVIAHILFDPVDEINGGINKSYRMILFRTFSKELSSLDDSLGSSNQNAPNRIISFFQFV